MIKTRTVLSVSVMEERGDKNLRRILSYKVSGTDEVSEIYYVFSGEVLPDPLENLDFVALTFVFFAMKNNMDLHIEGPVSKKLLANLDEFKRIWNKWCPNKYSLINISCVNEVDVVRQDKGDCILAYSGGVDANFTLTSHYSGFLGRRSRLIKSAIMVHGFDIPLDQHTLFLSSKNSAKKILDTFNIPLTTIATNIREIIQSDWEHEFGAALASCLHQFNGITSVGMIGSDEDYSAKDFVWGSNPISNQYLSGGGFEIETDGSGFTRTEKADLIAKFQFVKDNLRVCWEGIQPSPESSNCGKCEKCLRTKMNFLANRHGLGASLASYPSMREIVFINARNPVQIAYLEDILKVAYRNKIDSSWVLYLRLAISISKIRILLRASKGKIKRLLRMLSGSER